MHPDQSRTGCKRCVRENEKADGHRPEFGTVVGGSSRRQVMTTYQEEIELLEQITQVETPKMEARAIALMEQFNCTNDPDLREVIASDLFKEVGITVES